MVYQKTYAWYVILTLVLSILAFILNSLALIYPYPSILTAIDETGYLSSTLNKIDFAWFPFSIAALVAAVKIRKGKLALSLPSLQIIDFITFNGIAIYVGVTLAIEAIKTGIEPTPDLVLASFPSWVIELSLVISAASVILAIILIQRKSPEDFPNRNSKEEKILTNQVNPPTLSLSGRKTKKLESGYKCTLQFTPSNNGPLDIIVFHASIDDDSDVQIVDFWPSGGAFIAGKYSKNIASGGKKARLAYSLMNGGRPKFDLTLSGRARIKIEGNYLENEIIVSLE